MLDSSYFVAAVLDAFVCFSDPFNTKSRTTPKGWLCSLTKVDNFETVQRLCT